MKKKIMMADVARRVGVSLSTVSLVLSGKADVLRISPMTAMKVRQAARDMHYETIKKYRYKDYLEGELIACLNWLADSSYRIPGDGTTMFKDSDKGGYVGAQSIIKLYLNNFYGKDKGALDSRTGKTSE